MPANCQPQAGAAEASRGRGIGLLEGLKEGLLHLGRDADARVADLDQKRHLTVGPRRLRRHMNHDRALFGELDRIADQVEEHLLDPYRIAMQKRQRCVTPVRLQGVLASIRSVGERVDHLANDLCRIKVDLFEFEAPSLDLRIIENVVEHRHQRAGRSVEDPDLALLHRWQRGFFQQLDHPQDAGHRRAQFMAHHREKA